MPEHTELAVPTTDGDGRKPPEPMGRLEYDAIVGTIWSDLDDDPTRFNDLLHAALGYIGGLALAFDADPGVADWATAVLRSFEQRALWGPDHEQEDHR